MCSIRKDYESPFLTNLSSSVIIGMWIGDGTHNKKTAFTNSIWQIYERGEDTHGKKRNGHRRAR